MASIPSGLLPYLTGAKTDYSVNRDSITTVSIVILVIAGVTTSVRYYVRFIVLRSPGLDDRTSCLDPISHSVKADVIPLHF